MIRYDSVEVSFGDTVVIPDLDLEVREGEFFTLLGPSGCGKTTALRTLAGFIEPSRGEIYIDGKQATRLPSEKRRVGMVFQNYALFPSMTVWENIAFGLTVGKVGKQETADRVAAIAAQVELSADQLDKTVAELSGGQQQRVAIARALVLRPRILLLDEPLSNLDAKLRVQLREQLKALQTEVGITTVYVTHDQEEALTMSDRIAVFNRGVVEQVGTPEEIYDRSATEFVATFIGAINTLGPDLVAQVVADTGAVLDRDKASYLRLEKVWLQAAADPDHVLGLDGVPGPDELARPAGSARADGVAKLDGVVVARSYHGAYSVYTVDSHGSQLRVMVSESGAAPLGIGEAARLHVDPAWILQY